MNRNTALEVPEQKDLTGAMGRNPREKEDDEEAF